MSTATKTKQTSPSTELAKLAKARDREHAKARAARDQRDAWDAELPEMRARFGAHVTAHPDQVEGAQRLPKSGTEAEKLARAIIERTRTPNPHEADYCAARDEFHRHAEEVDAWKTANIEARLAEFDPDVEVAIEAIRGACEQLLAGCQLYAQAREKKLGVILDTQRLNGQHITDDGRVNQWAKIAREVIDGEVAKADLTPEARERVSG